MRTGDVDALLAIVPTEQSKLLKEWIDAGENAAKAINAFGVAVEEKFGHDPKGESCRVDYDRKKEFARDIKAFEVVGGKIVPEGQKATFKLRITAVRPHHSEEITHEEEFIATKDRGGWKLLPASLEKAKFDKGTEHSPD